MFKILCKTILTLLLLSVLWVLVFPLLPLGAPSSRLSSLEAKSVLDMHVHVAGFGYGDSGCFVHTDLSDSYKRYFYLFAFGVSEEDLKEKGDAFLVEKLNERVESSRLLKQVVVLALDAAFDRNGEMLKDITQAYVPNDFVYKQTSRFPRLLFGASINPYRTDAIERLRKAKENGAVLVKWIPPIMHIDPADEKLIPFYQELVKLDLPLLTHAGQERAFATAKDEYGDPLKLELPLSLGVSVIAAHIATTGTINGEEMIDRLLPMFERYPNLHADISSLTQANKLNYLEKGLLNTSISNRTVYGSDWPLQFPPLVSSWLHLSRISLADVQAISTEENVFDRDILLKLALGVSPEVFEQTTKFFE